jgi:hypothetical protein
MFYKLKTFIKYRYLRAYSKFLNSISSNSIDLRKLNDEQLAAIKIIKILASLPDTKILIAPISKKYYLKHGEIFIVINLNQITIINSIYHYDIYNSEQVSEYLTSYLKKIIEKKRLHMEDEMRAKIKNSLSHIITDLSQRFGTI